MDLDSIKITMVKIDGVNNPVVHINGISKKKVKFTLEVNNREISIKNYFQNSDGTFYLVAILPQKTKKIELYENNSNIKITEIKTSKLKRIIAKIKRIIDLYFNEVLYETCEKIGINGINIVGIKNPTLKIDGTLSSNDLIFEIYNNEKLLKYDINFDKKNNQFKLISHIPKSAKIIYVRLRDKDTIMEVCRIRTKKIKRYLEKVGEIINKKRNYKRLIFNSNIGINCAQITGVKNPLLHISGTKKFKSLRLELYFDNKKIDISKFLNDNSYNFCINYPLKKKINKVEFYCLEKSKKNLVCIINNKLFFRISNKILYIFKCFFGKVLMIIKKIKKIIILLYKGIKIAWTKYYFIIPPKILKLYIKKFLLQISDNAQLFYNPFIQSEYLEWLKKNEKFEKYEKLEYQPLLSILIPVYNVKKIYLSECLDSILNQTYQNFEVCIADDCSTNLETINTLKKYELEDKRIRVTYRKQNGHISNATNTALSMANGEFSVLVDNDDVLSKYAFYEMVKQLNKNKKLDLIYSDEDKLDLNGKRCEPHFKPDYSPDTLLGLNYICHLSMIRTKLLNDINGFTVGLEGAQDHDLFLRITEKTDRIYHIPKILYHWRMIPGSTAAGISNKSYALDKGKITIESALKRRKTYATVEKNERSTYYLITYNLRKQPLISIIIPTRDYAKITNQCLKSIYEKTTYKNFEIILINNDSKENVTYKMFQKYEKKYDNFKVMNINTEFNYSHLNNEAVKKAKGEYIVLLNNDTEIITTNWLEIMVGYAMQSHIGAVGVKLLYPDMTIQHGGVVLGLGGVAAHTYVGHDRNDLGTYGRLMVPYNYGAITAACLMIKKSKYQKVNGLEETLKVAYNDVDFCLKLLEKKYYNIFLPQVELIHYESKSRGFDTTKEKYLRFIKEQEFMYKKWKNFIGKDKFYNQNYSYKMWFMLDK